MHVIIIVAAHVLLVWFTTTSVTSADDKESQKDLIYRNDKGEFCLKLDSNLTTVKEGVKK